MRNSRLGPLCCLLLSVHGCDSRGASSDAPGRDALSVYVAASLARPFDALVDTFTTRTGAVIKRESGGSLEHVRKITELHRVPDVIVLADYELFPKFLLPTHVTWYAEFASDRMVVAYTDRSRYSARIDSTNWTSILSRSDVQVGRSDPDVAPVGYRTIALMSLAEQYYHEPGLAARLLANAPARNVRGNATELAALLELGELDYVYDYESLARARGFRWVQLPAQLDLSQPATLDGATVSVNPIVMALSVPKDAPHPDVARRFAAFVLSPEGRRLLRTQGVAATDQPRIVGDAPESIQDAAHRAPMRDTTSH